MSRMTDITPIPGHALTTAQLRSSDIPAGYRRLNPGERVPSNALYWATCGAWQTSPCTGLILRPESAATFVIPTSEEPLRTPTQVENLVEGDAGAEEAEI